MKSKYISLTGPLILILGIFILIATYDGKGNEEKPRKKVILLSGDDFNHASGTHEFQAGCILLKNALEESELGNQVDISLVHNWPEDTSVFADVDVIVHYYKGNQAHFANENSKFLSDLAAKGVSHMFMHYAVDPDTEVDGSLKEWTGAVYKDKFSTNPHWKLQAVLQNHPINQGLESYPSMDEWYVRMDFEKDPEVDYATADTVDQVYSVMHGEHDDIKGVKKLKAALKKAMTPAELTVFWAKERSDGGRGVGVTGGHFHKNWANDSFRKQVLNAIVWCAGLSVPEDGVSSPAITEEMINQNLDAKKKGGLKKITL